MQGDNPKTDTTCTNTNQSQQMDSQKENKEEKAIKLEVI